MNCLVGGPLLVGCLGSAPLNPVLAQVVKVHELFTGQGPFLQNESLCIVTCSIHLTRCALWQVVCIFFLCFFNFLFLELQFMRIKMYIKADGGAWMVVLALR